MRPSIATRWSQMEVSDAASQLTWTPCDVVTKWFEPDPISLRLLREMEADAMAAMIDQTRWNGAGARFCAIIPDNGQQRLLFAVIQEDGQTFSLKLDGPIPNIPDPKGQAPAHAPANLPHPRGQ